MGIGLDQYRSSIGLYSHKAKKSCNIFKNTCTFQYQKWNQTCEFEKSLIFIKLILFLVLLIHSENNIDDVSTNSQNETLHSIKNIDYLRPNHVHKLTITDPYRNVSSDGAKKYSSHHHGYFDNKVPTRHFIGHGNMSNINKFFKILYGNQNTRLRGIKIEHVNIRSLINKVDEVKQIVSERNHKF